jgi:hypothetical protein
MKKLAHEIAVLILNSTVDRRLTWLGPSKVRIIIGATVPASNNQTAVSRRKRFREALSKELADAGWFPVKGTAPHTYEKKSEA